MNLANDFQGEAERVLGFVQEIINALSIQNARDGCIMSRVILWAKFCSYFNASDKLFNVFTQLNKHQKHAQSIGYLSILNKAHWVHYANF